MYLYVAEFEDRVGVVKIGISIDFQKRLHQLSCVHGIVKNVQVFMGDNYKIAERYLHAVFKPFNEVFDGLDGGTEFFQCDVKGDIGNLIDPLGMKQLSNVELKTKQEKIKLPVVKPEKKIKSEYVSKYDGINEHLNFLSYVAENISAVNVKNRTCRSDRVYIEIPFFEEPEFDDISFAFEEEYHWTRISLFEAMGFDKKRSVVILSVTTYLLRKLEEFPKTKEFIEVINLYCKILKKVNEMEVGVA